MSATHLARQAEQRILLLRGQEVMLDFHLADLYAVETRALKQAVRRNAYRFPADFMFELNAEEASLLVSQNVIPGVGLMSDLSFPSGTSGIWIEYPTIWN